MKSLTHFEKTVLEVALEGDNPVVTSLRGQLPRFRVTKREATAIGFFTTILLPNAMGGKHTITGLRAISNPHDPYHDPSFVLFVEDDELVLEAYTIDGWKEKPIGVYMLEWTTGQKLESSPARTIE